MLLTRLINLPLRYKPWRPAHIALILDDITGWAKQPILSNDEHLKSVIAWICYAQDQRLGHADDGGVSAGWSFEDGWLPSYPETSGYIIETLIAAAKVLDNSELTERAARIVDW